MYAYNDVRSGISNFTSGPYLDGDWYIDSLSAYFLIMITFIGFLVSIYSIEYLEHELNKGALDIPRFGVITFSFISLWEP